MTLRRRPWIAAGLVVATSMSLGGLIVLLLKDRMSEPALGAVLGLMIIPGWLIGWYVEVRARRSSAAKLRQGTAWLDAMIETVGDAPGPEHVEAADALSASVSRLLHKVAIARAPLCVLAPPLNDSRITPQPLVPALTRSALLESSWDPMASQEIFVDPGDMIGRLEPRGLKWIDSSRAEQMFLGWPLETLREMSFLEIVHPDHRELAREQLLAAVAKGEAHGLVYRIKTARSEAKAVEINVGIRYTRDGTVDHLRCHVTDVTERLRASRELRRRTREVLAANGQLVVANIQLRELKDLYSDLYQHAPAMYFSLDESGAFRDCNNTLLATLGYDRSELVGRPYVSILPAWRRPAFASNFAHFLSTGRIEVESQWITAEGRSIDVQITGTAVFGPSGEIVRSRSVALDVTASKALESQLQENNARLARAVEDLARKNKELDDFTYSVSHDLQAPLRTLISFSGLLLEGQGDRLDDEGREQLSYLIDASKRMRSQVTDLLALSKAGKTAGPCAPCNLADVMAVVRADLASTIAAKNGILTVREPLPVAWGDEDRIARLLCNLVGNALKYHRPGESPVVEVSASSDEAGSVSITVADRGIGIDPQYHERIFGLFRRLHARDQFEGTGAGLAICRKIAEAHGGTIAVESAVGQGATFRVRLPGRGCSPPETRLSRAALT